MTSTTGLTNIESALTVVYVTSAETANDSIVRFVSSKVHSITLHDTLIIIEHLVEKGMNRIDAKRAILRAYRASRPSDDLCWEKLGHYKKALKEMKKKNSTTTDLVSVMIRYYRNICYGLRTWFDIDIVDYLESV